MTTYVSVALGRIQSHLSRSRHLWGRRGASEEIIRLTMMPQTAHELGLSREPLVCEVLAWSGVYINPEGADIDGVISLKADDETTGRDAGFHLARQMKRRLPACTVTVQWATAAPGESYATLLSLATADRWQSVTFQPASYEFPLVRTCDECRVSPASHLPERRFPDATSLELCEDCFVRLEHAERRTPTVADWTVVNRTRSYPNRFCSEWWLLDRLNRSRPAGEQLRGSKDLGELGELIRPVVEGHTRTHRDNHTALVAADGNGLGAIFDALRVQAAAQGSTDVLVAMSQAIKQALSEAVEVATRAILSDEDRICPAVVHIMGGDDLLVSLPGERCWEFLGSLLNSFRGLTPAPPDGLSSATMSAGMVICRAEIPIGNQVTIANHLLAEAKRHVAGEGWSFAWLDLTQDGPDGSHPVWTLDDLDGRRAAIEHLRLMTPNSSRAMLACLSGEDQTAKAQKLAHLASRMPETAEFLGLLGIKPPELSAAQSQTIIDIASIGRWWR